MEDILVTDKHFREWEQATFGYGYGTGEAFILPILHSFLTTIPLSQGYSMSGAEAMYGGPAAWLLLNALCRADILDYGTSPRAGWLTYHGEALRIYLLSKTPQELYDIVTQAFDPTVPLCSPYFCNCPGAVDSQGCHNNPLFDPVMTVSGGRCS